MRATLVVCLVLTACGNTEPDGWVYDQIPIDGPVPEIAVCTFESGRPCRADTICLGDPGNECNYYACVWAEDSSMSLQGTAVGCQAGTVEPRAEGAPFNCDPSTVRRDPFSPGGITPPPGPCPLGALYALDPARTGFPFLFCVPVEQCAPIACDPQFDGDGCPSGYGCSAATRTCVAS